MHAGLIQAVAIRQGEVVVQILAALVLFEVTDGAGLTVPVVRLSMPFLILVHADEGRVLLHKSRAIGLMTVSLHALVHG